MMSSVSTSSLNSSVALFCSRRPFLTLRFVPRQIPFLDVAVDGYKLDEPIISAVTESDDPPLTKVGGGPSALGPGCSCARLRGALSGCRSRSSRSRLLRCLSLSSLLLDLLQFRHDHDLRRRLNSVQLASALSSLRLVERLLCAYVNRMLYSTLILKEEKYQETLAFRFVTFSLAVLAEPV